MANGESVPALCAGGRPVIVASDPCRGRVTGGRGDWVRGIGCKGLLGSGAVGAVMTGSV
jgi:hypothetical protein